MNDLGQVAPTLRQSMMHKMRVSSLNYIRLLRYAGLFTYACVGIPLLWDAVRPVDEAGDPNDRMWWFISYAVFGLAYWFVTRDLGNRKPWQLKIPLLLLMNVAAIGISYFSQKPVVDHPDAGHRRRASMDDSVLAGVHLGDRSKYFARAGDGDATYLFAWRADR